MASLVTRIILSVVVVVAGVLSACTPKSDGPAPVAEQFFAALANGDTSAAAAHSDKPEDARAALNAAWAGLQAEHFDAQVLGSTFDEDTGSVDYRYTWHLPKNRTWTYDGRLSMIRNEGRWEVRWTPAGLHPKLGEHQTFALRADTPQRASVNEVGGTDVLKPGYLYHYELDAKKAGAQLMSTVHAIVDALRPFDNTLDPQRLAEQASSSTKPVDLITLKPDDNNRIPP
ncbi:MAG TPA: NTF2-like N-terminal transpeptidase domain-containing protein, partial [Mycobacterium sp.]|nr:NTF2-like N-terminal transpeptidase domain-containing protein [Mycobacterium sp.]